MHLQSFRLGIYNLVVLDIKMPELDGVKLYVEIRTKDKRVRVCFITASEEYYTERFTELRKKKNALCKNLFQWMVSSPVLFIVCFSSNVSALSLHVSH
jgi:CheY-like chemotaxis protein